MPSIFVDANILLGFWSLSEGRVPSELLSPLVDLKENLLITQQVADEVLRNKLRVFLKTSSVAPAFSPQFPDHFTRDRNVVLLNSELKSLTDTAKKARSEWELIRDKIAAEISSNTDQASEMLNNLLRSAAAPSQKQLDAARERRERGNPPGKRADPLGDQISWEQFLAAVEGEPSVWIITKDSDFADRLDRRLLLNPFLRRELVERGIKKIEAYDNLSSAIRALKEAGLPVAKSISAEKLAQLESDEGEAQHVHPSYRPWPDEAWECPRCRKISLNSFLTAHPSRHGGWSYWTTCSHCGFRYDTGEPYDD